MSIIYIKFNLILAPAKLLLYRNQILIGSMRKGLSPLVAAVILIAATMSIAGILSYWTTGFIKGQLGEASNATDESRCLSAEFKLYSGRLDESEEEPKLYLVLENTRSYDLTLTDLYLFDESNMLPTIPLNEVLEGNSLKALNKTVSDFTRAIIKTNCPEVSIEFTKSQVTG